MLSDDSESAYGCESCAESIPAERLDLFRAATTCVACKQRSERRR